MSKNQQQEIHTLLEKPSKIVLVGHQNPDGDAIGSALGLSHYLCQFWHHVTVIVPNDFPSFLKWLPQASDILVYDTQASECDSCFHEADIVFILDFNAPHRAGLVSKAFENFQGVKVMIDHHQQPSDYADYVITDTAMSSTCEMVYHFIASKNPDVISPEIANCLYLGIMTDTGSFKFSITTSTTHRVVATLIDKGAASTAIHEKVYDTNRLKSLQLLGRALQNLKIVSTQRTAYITLSQQDLDDCDYQKGDTEGIVNYALSLQNVIFAAIFIEQKDENLVKISLRSKGDFDVNSFSRKYFDGGGHKNAAGGKSLRSLEATENYFLKVLASHQKELSQ